MFKRIGLALLLTAIASSEITHQNFCSTEHGDNKIMVLLPGSVFDRQQLCVGTQQQMDAGVGIDCYESIPLPVPPELRTPVLPARINVPSSSPNSYPPIPGQP